MTYVTPATPGEGSQGLPTPSLPDNTPAAPSEGSQGLPTPSLPDNTPATPGEGPAGLPTPSLPGGSTPSLPVGRCPANYTAARVQPGQSFADLLLQNDVSYRSMRLANPSLSTTRPTPGQLYCVPPACPTGYAQYVLSTGETLDTLSRTLGVSKAFLLFSNPTLAPSDFTFGQEICLPIEVLNLLS